jgi:transposase-like protein
VKQEYQSKSEAAEQFRAAKEASADAIQLALPTAEMLQLQQKGVGELIRRVGKLFIASVLEAEVEQRVGRRSKRQQERQAYRWGSEHGYCVVDGQRVPISRPRIRGRDGRELPLGSYQLFQQASPAEETVWSSIMRGLSMRNYKEVLQQFLEAYGLEKSTISERFIEASRKKLKQLMTRSLAHLQLCAMIVDGTIFKGQHLVVAIGMDRLGHKIVLGIVQGATENATVVSGLLDQLSERGIDFGVPRLYLLDGGKALRSAIRRHAGEAAFLQRCQVHKIRNVTDYLPEEQRPAVKFRLRAAYSMLEASDARQALYRLHSELTERNPSAADSLAEGLEETLTIQELGVHARLRRSLASTNGIESSFSVVETICKQVKRWQGSDHRLRWVASAMLYVETRWNRLHGYRHLPLLVHNLERAFAVRLALNQNPKTAASAA